MDNSYNTLFESDITAAIADQWGGETLTRMLDGDVQLRF